MSRRAVFSVLVFMAVLAWATKYVPPQPALATTACVACQSSCGDPEYIEVFDHSENAKCCYDWDGIPPPHCCNTTRKVYKLWHGYPAMPAGECFQYICGTAVSDGNACSNSGCV